MQVSELMRLLNFYKTNHNMPEERAREKAINAYNSAHPKDQVPNDIWERIGDSKDEFMAIAQKESAELTNLRNSNQELNKVLSEAVQRIKENESEIKALTETGKKLKEENDELVKQLDEATKPNVNESAETPAESGSQD